MFASFCVVLIKVQFENQQGKSDQDVLDLENLKNPAIDATTAERQRDKLASLEMQLSAASAANDREEAPPSENLDKSAVDVDTMKTTTNDDIHAESGTSIGNTNTNGDRVAGAQPKVSSTRT